MQRTTVVLLLFWLLQASALQAAEAPSIESINERLSLIERKLRILGADTDDGMLRPVHELLADPEALYSLAERNLQQNKLEEAFDWAVVFHVLHPGHERNREGLILARAAFRPLYNHERLHNLDSLRWRGHARDLLYSWMKHRIRRGDFDPREFGDFFRGMPFSFYHEFFTGGIEREQSIGNWRITAELDNGRVYSIEAELTEPDPHP